MIADDVDAFVLLAYCYHTCELASPVYMVSPVQQQISIDIAGGKSLSLIGNVTAHLRPQRLHCKQQNSSQHIMVNMLRGALIWQNEGRNSRTTTLVEEQLQPQKLRSLPSTSAAFLENVKRCHYHVCNRKSALLPDPLSMIPAEFGWEADIENKTLLAQSLPYATALAPDYILRLNRCSCH